jgi:aminoglycoside phosphotransferase (APT) family kinase protein
VKTIEPTAFLHDATTKNVIVDEGRVTGLVDVDHMAFGDALWAPTLTRMSLLAAHRPTGYADEQIEELSATSDARERADLYTILHCLSFLGELGQAFNQDEAAPVDMTHQRHLEAVLESLI